ncbi:ATP-binding protein [Candidatus Sumerlaeota bacterium]|nr:ATP-binding protein [Candidatus Sumerlaeota bacterium]
MTLTPTPTPLPPDSLMGFPEAPMARTLAVACPEEEERRIRSWHPAEKLMMARSVAELAGLVVRERHPLILLHPDSVREDEIETVRLLRDLPCHPLVGIYSDKDRNNDAFQLAVRAGIGCILPHDCFQHCGELDQIAGWLEQGGPKLGIDNHLDPNAVTYQAEVAAKADKPDVIEEVLNFVKRIRSDTKFLFELRLILEETINNCIFHAFRDADGREKYTIDNFSRLDADEKIVVDYGADDRTIAVAVSDNQGQLKRETVLSKIQRQLSAQGILDQSGRGLHLIYALAGRFYINLRPYKVTQMVVLFPAVYHARPEFSSHHPLLIFTQS